MRKMTFPAIVVTLLFFTFAFAQIEITGSLETNNRFRATGEKEVTWNENTLSLFFNSNFSDRAGLYADIRFVSVGKSEKGNIEEYISSGVAYTQPWDVEFREAYIDIYGFPLNNIDLRIGKQRIAWGTADKFNPTDNLNPDNLDDIYAFGDHFGSNAVSATCYFGLSRLQAVYIPVFTPAILPSGEWLNAFMGSSGIPDSLLPLISHNIPDDRITKTSSYGAKFSSMFGGFDFSISYYKGREDIPVVCSKINLTQAGPPIDVSIEHPEKEVIGFDFAGSIGKLGIWGEFAYNNLKKVRSVQIPPPDSRTAFTLTTSLTAGGKFTKYVLGCDYTFPNNVYFNLQYLHGFLHELKKDDLKDYFIVRVERDFPNKNFKLIPLNGIISIADWDKVEDTYGFSIGPGLELRPADALEINIGLFVIDAKPGSFFYHARDLDELYFKVEYSF